MLELKDVYSGYGKIISVQGISLHIHKNHISAMIGVNGSGKSTILKTIVGLLKPSSGSILFKGKRIDGLPSYKVVRKGLSVVLEGRQIFPELTVRENLLTGTYIRKDKFGVKKSYELIFNIFPILKKRLAQSGGTLSGGEQQMLAIGRALMLNPDFLLLDEPSLGLAPLVVREIFQVMETIRQQGITMLLVEQNVRMAFSVAEYGILLDSGRVKTQGRCVDLAENNIIKRTLLAHK